MCALSVILLLLESSFKDPCDSVMPRLSCVDTDRLPDNAVMTCGANLVRLHPVTCTATAARNAGQAEPPCPCACSANEGLWEPCKQQVTACSLYNFRDVEFTALCLKFEMSQGKGAWDGTGLRGAYCKLSDIQELMHSV